MTERPTPVTERSTPVTERTTVRLRAAGGPGAAVYGLVTVGAVLAVETTKSETYVETVAAATIAAVIYWLAHAYADLLGIRLTSGARLSVGGLGRCLRAQAPLLLGATAPVVTVIVCGVAGASLGTAAWLAIGTCVALVIVLEVVAGVRGGAEGAELVLEAAVGTLLGALLVALKIVLH